MTNQYFIIRAIGSLVVVLLLPAILMAQSPRRVVIEEVTNASCLPCAQQNIIFDKYLHRTVVSDGVIPIIYHGWWPGRDVMYTRDSIPALARVPYYGITGAPTAVVAGSFYRGAPMDTFALERDVVRLSATMSPITMNATQTTDGSDIRVSLSISSIEPVSGRLHIVVVEKEHYYANAGTNGEKNFHYIARRLLTPTTGQQITIEPGRMIDSLITFAIDPEWNTEGVYVAAFVQSANKEILQGTSTMIPEVTLGQTPERAVVASVVGEPKEWVATLTAHKTASYNVIIGSQLPQGWTTTVTVGGITVESHDRVNLMDGVQTSLGVTIDPGASTALRGDGSVTVSLVDDSGKLVAERVYRYYAAELRALIFQRHEYIRPEVIGYYAGAMDRGDVRYAVVRSADELLFDFSDHVVVYEVGKWALTAADIAQLKAAINAGGTRIYMIGAEIGFGLADPANTDPATPHDIPFMRDYLHATYVKDDNASTRIVGVVGDPVGSGLDFVINGIGSVGNQDTPDELKPTAGALPVLLYGNNTNQVAAIRYADARNRLLFVGFGAEGIADLDQRTNLLKSGIAWLMGTETTSGIDPQENTIASGTNIGKLHPNPTSGFTEIPILLSTPASVEVDIYDRLGVHVISLGEHHLQMGSTSLSCDLSGIPSGSYTMIIRSGGNATSHAITVVR